MCFTWNNKFRGRIDRARLFRSLLISTALHIFMVLIPIISLIWIFIHYNIWIVLLSGAVYYFVSNRIQWWYYGVVFKQYKALHVYDLREKAELEKYTDAEIDASIHEWLMKNVKT